MPRPRGFVFEDSGAVGIGCRVKGVKGMDWLPLVARVVLEAAVFIEGENTRVEGCSQPMARLPIWKVVNYS